MSKKSGFGSLLASPILPSKNKSDEHAELGGSSAKRWPTCHGSVALLRRCPPGEDTVYSIEGTKQHAILRTLLEAFFTYKEKGTPFDEDKILSECSNDDARDALERCVEAVWDKVLGRTLTGKVWLLETKFTLDENLGMFGTPDGVFAYIDDRGRRVVPILDYKNGRTPVDAKGNAQLAFYGCCVRKHLKDHGKDLDLVRGIIYQPFDYTAKDPYKETVFTAKQLDAWEKKFFKAAHDIYFRQSTKFKTGEHCMFCGAQPLCEAYRKDLNHKSSLKLVDKSADLPAIELLSEKQLLGIVEHREQIKKFVDAVYKLVLKDAMKGRFPSIKVIQMPGRRKWKKGCEDAVLKELLEHGELADNFVTTKLKGIGVIEKKLGKVTVDEFTERGSGQFLIVDADDPREKYQGALDLLEEIAEE